MSVNGGSDNLALVLVKLDTKNHMITKMGKSIYVIQEGCGN